MSRSQKSIRGGQEVISRRSFVRGAASMTAAFTIVPRHVLGGPGYIAPSEKSLLAAWVWALKARG